MAHASAAGKPRLRTVRQMTRGKAARAAAPHRFALAPFFNRDGTLKIERLSAGFRMSKSQLAETVGLPPEALYKAKRTKAAKTQARMREMLEIVNRVTSWAGGREQAMAWYRAAPIPALGDRTAEALVKSGEASVVRTWLDVVATGGFA
jgi:hypothetical protein